MLCKSNLEKLDSVYKKIKKTNRNWVLGKLESTTKAS